MVGTFVKNAKDVFDLFYNTAWAGIIALIDADALIDKLAGFGPVVVDAPLSFRF